MEERQETRAGDLAPRESAPDECAPNESARNESDRNEFSSESGFSYIDLMVAITIMLVGIIALLATMTLGLVTTGRGQQQLIAKQYLTSSMESIFSARDLDNPNIPNFAVIANDNTTVTYQSGTSTVTTKGIFLSGKQPIFNSTGNDGIIGTADDGWGPDGKAGTSDDLAALSGMQRQITITSVSSGVIQITVTVFFEVSGFVFQESMTSYMANYNTQNV
jgi:hypothetical protein